MGEVICESEPTAQKYSWNLARNRPKLAQSHRERGEITYQRDANHARNGYGNQTENEKTEEFSKQ